MCDDNRQDGSEHIQNLQYSKISQRCQEPVTPIACWGERGRNIPNGTGFSRYTATIVVIVEVFSFSSRYTTPCVAVGIFG
jgi:hypothetical protein